MRTLLTRTTRQVRSVSRMVEPEHVIMAVAYLVVGLIVRDEPTVMSGAYAFVGFCHVVTVHKEVKGRDVHHAELRHPATDSTDTDRVSDRVAA